ncbi:MAG: hypothetical protein ACREIU_15705 [Planctomycetota bacterium]
MAVAIGGLSSAFGTGCTQVKTVAPSGPELRLGEVEEASSKGTSWFFLPEPRGRWYPSAVVLPDDWNHWREVHGFVPASEMRTWPVGLEGRGNLSGTESRAEAAWSTLNSRRPAIIGRRGGAKEILEIEVLEGERVGSVALVAVESLLGVVGPGGAVVRLPFSEVGSSPVYRPFGRVFLEVEDREVPPGAYLLVVVTESGSPSPGQLVVVRGSIPSTADE